MNMEITTQINHSIHIPKKILINAAISVDNEIRLSFNASTPLAIRLHELSFFHRLLTYLQRKNFAKMAAVTTIIVVMV